LLVVAPLDTLVVDGDLVEEVLVVIEMAQHHFQVHLVFL
jgi:hypothetical protein